jgi:predicted transcriptional regulator
MSMNTVRKVAEYEQAVALRKRGFTYGDIAKIVGVSKATVSNWLSREAWSMRVRDDNTKRAARDNSKRMVILNKARTKQYAKLYAEAERSAATEFKHYKHDPLFMAGIGLYMAIGDISPTPFLRVSGTRMESHRVFVHFATEFLGVPREKIRFLLHVHKAHDPLVCSKRWSKTIRVPIEQFHKYQVIQGGDGDHTLHFGVGNTIIGGTVFKKKLLAWVQLAAKEL